MLPCIEYILLFILINYIIYSFTRSFSTLYVDLLFTRSTGAFLSMLLTDLALQDNL